MVSVLWMCVRRYHAHKDSDVRKVNVCEILVLQAPAATPVFAHKEPAKATHVYKSNALRVLSVQKDNAILHVPAVSILIVLINRSVFRVHVQNLAVWTIPTLVLRVCCVSNANVRKIRVEAFPAQKANSAAMVRVLPVVPEFLVLRINSVVMVNVFLTRVLLSRAKQAKFVLRVNVNKTSV